MLAKCMQQVYISNVGDPFLIGLPSLNSQSGSCLVVFMLIAWGKPHDFQRNFNNATHIVQDHSYILFPPVTFLTERLQNRCQPIERRTSHDKTSYLCSCWL